MAFHVEVICFSLPHSSLVSARSAVIRRRSAGFVGEHSHHAGASFELLIDTLQVAFSLKELLEIRFGKERLLEDQFEKPALEVFGVHRNAGLHFLGRVPKIEVAAFLAAFNKAGSLECRDEFFGGDGG